MGKSSANNIFLVGPMGVGKTTIGKMLAKELSLEFIDSDQEIERRAGADVSWIFDVEGEQGFRDRESQVIDDLTNRSGVLLATGGGSVLRPMNRRILSTRGVVVFLDTSLDLQIKRTERDKKRPLLQNVDKEEVLRKLKDERQPLYEEVCDFQVFVGEGSSRRIVMDILDKLHDEEGGQDS
ncbi:MAG TPA: shikimate kinase AroK [Pseudomonadales bacterium]|nr:shikimate kinase AroK [Pseudomonadales bacterium]